MSVTHAIYAKKIVEHIKLMYNVNLKKYNIIYGSIKPDISVLFSKHPHYINKSLNEMCKNVNLLIKLTDGRYGIESRSFARELGTVLHYTADFFCKAHNDINGQPHLTNYYHILYEQRFQNQLRAYELDVVRENVINFIDYNLEKIKDNLIILTFIAKCTADFNQVKLASIRKYINKKLPHTKTLSEQYLNNYMDVLKPDETSFFKAVDNLKSKTPEEVEEVIKEALKISAADGILSYQERYYIAEIVQALREYGIEPDIDF